MTPAAIPASTSGTNGSSSTKLLVEHTNPLTTDQILSTDRSGRSLAAQLHRVSQPARAAADPAGSGVIRTFNIVLAARHGPDGAGHLCAGSARDRRRRGSRRGWPAGVRVVARRSWRAATGHFSLVAAAPLAAFILCLINADRSRRPRDAALAGLCMAWAGFCDAYYAVFCLIIAIGYLASRCAADVILPPSQLRAMAVDARHPASCRSAGWSWVCCLAAVGDSRFSASPSAFDGLYTPVLVLTLLLLARVAVDVRPHVAPVCGRKLVACRGARAGDRGCWRVSGRCRPCCTVSASGWSRAGSSARLRSGAAARAVSICSRSSSSIPITSYRARSTIGSWPTAPRSWNTRRRSASSRWPSSPLRSGAAAIVREQAGCCLTVGFAALSLGPFIHVAGVNTYVPGPWALLRYVPLFGIARTPTRFAVVAALGLAILLAGALAALGRRFPQQRRA